MQDKKTTLLAVLAHPDDESFGMGGTLALYAEKGVEINLICATRGEAGEVEPRYLKDHQSIGALREDELRCAAGHLGIKGMYFLDYRDSGMSGSPDNHHPDALVNAPIENVAEKITHIIRKLRPRVVLTFDPIGGYHHPDHIAIHKATVKAFDLAADPDFQDKTPPHKVQKLYYHTISRRFLRLVVWILRITGKDPRHWGKNGDIDLASLAVEDFPVNARIDYNSVKQRKAAAANCHASQGGGGLSNGFLNKVIRLLNWKDIHTDSFMRAYPQPDSNTLETDLFEGII